MSVAITCRHQGVTGEGTSDFRSLAMAREQKEGRTASLPSGAGSADFRRPRLPRVGTSFAFDLR